MPHHSHRRQIIVVATNTSTWRLQALTTFLTGGVEDILTPSLVGKKTDKKILVGKTVLIQVKGPDGARSNQVGDTH
ncbi:MAG TPA: hypothetical protein VEZ90_15415 [Blastocatellia bacterium]|nr:hypothetical protein [Blastocatellia bacterium]